MIDDVVEGLGAFRRVLPTLPLGISIGLRAIHDCLLLPNGVCQPRQERLIVPEVRHAHAAASARLELILVLTAIALELLQLHLGVCDLLLDSRERDSQPSLGVVVQVLHGLHALGASHAAPPMTAPSSTRLRL